jgi:hypothetical protein
MGFGRAARQGRIDSCLLCTVAIQETPANMHPRWTWTAAICVRAAAERQGRSQAMIWSDAGVAGALRFTQTQTTAHLPGPCLKQKGCDTCDTCKRLLPSGGTEVRDLAAVLPSQALDLVLQSSRPSARFARNSIYLTHGPDDVCDP